MYGNALVVHLIKSKASKDKIIDADVKMNYWLTLMLCNSHHVLVFSSFIHIGNVGHVQKDWLKNLKALYVYYKINTKCRHKSLF